VIEEGGRALAAYLKPREQGHGSRELAEELNEVTKTLGQVAHFKTNSNLTAQELQRAMNALMPPTVRIVDSVDIGQDFHSRWQAQAKTYRYRIYRGRILPPFLYGRVLHYPWDLDEDAMAVAAREFEGEKDFTSFAASTGSEEDDKDRDMMRLIYSSEIVHDAANCEIAYVVRGKSFLRYMVRKIVGTILDAGKGKIAAADIARIFEARDRTLSGPTVQPQGLYLVSLEYPDPANSWATFKAQRPKKA